MIYSDEDKIDEEGRRESAYLQTPIGRRTRCSRAITSRISASTGRSLQCRTSAAFAPGFEGSQDYDLLLRVTERSERVAHLRASSTIGACTQDRQPATRDRDETVCDCRHGLLRARRKRWSGAANPRSRVVHDEVRSGLYSVRYDIRDGPGRSASSFLRAITARTSISCLRSHVRTRRPIKTWRSSCWITAAATQSRCASSCDWVRAEPERRSRCCTVRRAVQFSRINNYAAAPSERRIPPLPQQRHRDAQRRTGSRR